MAVSFSDVPSSGGAARQFVMANQIPRTSRTPDWPYEREGYSDTTQPAYASASTAPVEAAPHSGRLEAFLGSVLAGCGAVWTAQVLTQSGFVPGSLTLHSHPLELTGFGLLLWLHGKYRKSVQVR